MYKRRERGGMKRIAKSACGVYGSGMEEKSREFVVGRRPVGPTSHLVCSGEHYVATGITHLPLGATELSFVRATERTSAWAGKKVESTTETVERAEGPFVNIHYLYRKKRRRQIMVELPTSGKMRMLSRRYIPQRHTLTAYTLSPPQRF